MGTICRHYRHLDRCSIDRRAITSLHSPSSLPQLSSKLCNCVKSIGVILHTFTVTNDGMKALSRILTMLSWGPVAVVVNDFVGTVHWTMADDMQPAVEANRLCFIRRCRYLSTLKHGEVLALVSPDGSHIVLRRLIGLPGDYVRPRNFQVHQSPTSEMRFVPPGFVWVETDTSSAATPSSVFSDTSVPVAVICGRVTHTLPSFQPVKVEPSDRAFPSNNRQLYSPPRPVSGR